MMTCLGTGSQILLRITILQFFFMHLKLRNEYKEDYKEVGESKAGIRLQDS